MFRTTEFKRLLSSVVLLTFLISNIFFGFPIDSFIKKINESKIVDNLYWAMKDEDVIDRGEINIPTVVKQALAAQATIDSAISTASTEHLGGSPTTVFTSQSTGYAFYVDSTGVAVYSKTTNGGVTWGTPVTVDSKTDIIQVAVWYDKWTPGDSGTLIHIATTDVTNDDIWYRNLNTSTDTLSSGPTNITSGLSYTGSLAAGTNHVAISKATDGALYAAVSDATDNMAVRCTTTCTTSGNWSVSEPASWSVGNDFQILIPRLSGEMMFIWWDISATTNDIKYSRYTGSWSTFANIDTALDNTTYDASFGATVNPSTGDVYLAYAGQAATLGTDDDVRVRKFSGSSWSSLTDVVTNSACAGGSTCGITGTKIVRDNNTGNLYVMYAAQSTAGTATTGNLYWKYSTNDGSTWSSEFGPIYSSNDNIYGNRLSLMPTSNERIYATWYAATPDDLFGRPIAPKTFEQAAYRFFANSDSTDVGSALATQDTSATLNTSGDAFRLRMLLHIGVSDLFTNEGSFKIQSATKSGTCDSGFSGETYADITTVTDIAYNNNPTPSDGVILTANANDPTHSGHTIVNHTYEEANNFTNSQGNINEGQDGKWDFALIDNGAPASTSYCFRVVKSDGSLLDTYTVIPEIATAAGGNSLPIASSVSIDSGAASVTLTEGTTRNVSCVGTVTDNDGFADITSVTGDFFRTSVGIGSGLDDNNHYQLVGDSQCVPSGGAGNSETYTCTFPAQYFADATDAGSPNSADTWTCTLTPSDTVGAGTATSDTIEMSSLFALDVTASINYGTLSPNTDTGATNQTTTVTNTGNRDMDPQLSDAIGMYSPSGWIAPSYQKYSASPFTYSSGGTALSSTPTTLNLTLPQRTSTTVTANVSWGIGVPNGTPSGNYSGTNTFTATTGI